MSTSLRCSRCQIQLRSSTSAGTLACSVCGGEFCDRQTLEGLIESARRSRAAGTYVRAPLSLSEAVRYRPCPMCGELMLRRNFGEASGVVVEVCAPHGVWFDRGELLRVLSFCSLGGFDRAIAEAAERVEARRRMDDFQRRLTSGGPSPIDASGGGSFDETGLASVLELIGLSRA